MMPQNLPRVLRRVGRSWWLWATGVVVAFSVVGAVITPVFIAPVFNTYTRLTDAHLRDPILQMARANGIKADAVYVVVPPSLSRIAA